MPKKVICRLPNASELINGVEFVPTTEGVISKDVLDDAVAERFKGIPGYTLIDVQPVKASKHAEPKQDTAPDDGAASGGDAVESNADAPAAAAQTTAAKPKAGKKKE